MKVWNGEIWLAGAHDSNYTKANKAVLSLLRQSGGTAAEFPKVLQMDKNLKIPGLSLGPSQG